MHAAVHMAACMAMHAAVPMGYIRMMALCASVCVCVASPRIMAMFVGVQEACARIMAMSMCVVV